MITSVIITKNEEKMVEGCLRSIFWADEIVIVDNNSDDNTIKICKKYTDKIFQTSEKSFAQIRNIALEKAKGEWIIYIDADERVEENLKKEILDIINNTSVSAFAISRKNIMFGRWLKHGGWHPDYQIRLFQKNKLKGWLGKIHERPDFNGNLGYLKNSLIHYTHKNISETLNKKLVWSEIEVDLRLKSSHPKITWPRILKVMISEFIRRYFLKFGWRDGTEGLIAAIDESFSLFIIYTRLWEKQKNLNLKIIC